MLDSRRSAHRVDEGLPLSCIAAEGGQKGSGSKEEAKEGVGPALTEKGHAKTSNAQGAGPSSSTGERCHLFWPSWLVVVSC